nr:hypothetical protein [Brevibacillus laterosporus]
MKKRLWKQIGVLFTTGSLLVATACSNGTTESASTKSGSSVKIGVLVDFLVGSSS